MSHIVCDTQRKKCSAKEERWRLFNIESKKFRLFPNDSGIAVLLVAMMQKDNPPCRGFQRLGGAEYSGVEEEKLKHLELTWKSILQD